jgi:regulator of sigma E protease
MDLATLRDLLLVFIGFGLIIFVHELGHFLAARWAGIRVLAFALGFGRAIASYRRGLGWRWGSSEGLDHAESGLVSPTEYRLNWLPFGGYVKMLGQEDLNPQAVSREKDSYQNCKPWKRMIVISAGVVMNLITAALLFMLVFKVGLRTEAPVIGVVSPGSPAALVSGSPASGTGAPTIGLRPGDRVIEVNGKPARQFNDLTMATAMARRGSSVTLLVERDTPDGAGQRLAFSIQPKTHESSKLLEIGVEPARTNRLFDVPKENRGKFDQDIARLGLPGVEPLMELVRVGTDRSPRGPRSIDAALNASGGDPVEVEFRDPVSGRSLTVTLPGRADLETTSVTIGQESSIPHLHVLGLAPVIAVSSPEDRATRQGLKDGDVFARLGSLEFPSVAAGIAEIRAHKGRTIDIVVLRADRPKMPLGEWTEVPLRVAVSDKGTIGFIPANTAEFDTLVSIPPAGVEAPAASLVDRAGTRIVSIAGRKVADFREIRRVLGEAAGGAVGVGDVLIPVVLREPVAVGQTRDREVAWTLDAPARQRLASLGWHSPLPHAAFELEQTLLRARGPIDAIEMGFGETKRVMVMTYLTFARLFEGTVKVEHLKGPVGIAHLGTKVASRGWIWLLFFLALVSVNLAVINFLPLPIVDGGQFIFLLIEQARGRPVSVGIQNFATLAGLVLIVGVFLLVTFNDIVNLLG